MTAFASVDRLTTAAEKNPLAIKEAKAAGRKVVGLYCLYSPMEVPLAAGAIPVVLCGTRNDPIATAEKTLPRNLCPLIKSSFGFAVDGRAHGAKAGAGQWSHPRGG
jgi:benzoyl-CoA reductase/2-hydroxyglutaryl-CoA dehydratase subunit BcrC/BadD/HgdB